MIHTVSDYLYEAHRMRQDAFIRWIEHRERRKAYSLIASILGVLALGFILWLKS